MTQNNPANKKNFSHEELRRKIYDKEARRISAQVIGKNKLEWHGLENRILEGPNIIVANHPGYHEDIAALITVYPERMLTFTANKELFSKEQLNQRIKDTITGSCIKNFKKALGKANYENAKILGTILGEFFNFITAPIRGPVSSYISSRLNAVGAIPVNVLGTNNTDWKSVAEKYLLEEEALVFMQYHKDKKDKNTRIRKHILSKYAPEGVKAIDEFRYGAFNLAEYMLKKYDMNVPVTPISIRGTSFFSLPFRKIIINIGKPHYFKDYLSSQNPVADFKNSLEQEVVRLYLEYS